MSGKSAAKRQRLFDLFAAQPGHQDLTQGRIFWCPLCRRPFTRQDAAGSAPKLTLAHIIPESQGGTWKTLCCAECNNGNGHAIEIDFMTSQKLADMVLGRGAVTIRLAGGKVKAEMSHHPEQNRIDLKILTPMKNPALPAFQKTLEGLSAGDTFNLTLPWFRDGWWRATVCQSAYLLMFKYFGYDFARCPTYNHILDHIRSPSDSNPGVLMAEVNQEMATRLLEGKQAAVIFVREPKRLILALMRFTSPGSADQYLAVVMPGPGEAQLAGEFTVSGIVYSPVEDVAESSGRWGNSFSTEWRHWISYERPAE